jgi:argininosuccinate lyase
MTGVISGLVLDRDALRRSGGREEMLAASIAVTIARHGLPFRLAHELVGSLVAQAQKNQTSLRDAALSRLASRPTEVREDVERLFNPDEAVRAKIARGGTAPQAVTVSLDAARRRVGK